MKPLSLSVSLLLAALIAILASSVTVADDGQLLKRPVTSQPGVDLYPPPIGEHAHLKLMNFRVPAQAANGELVEIEYFDIDESLRYTLTTAKPLVAFSLFGPVIQFKDHSQSGFPGHGRRDAFAAVSLDDGETWRRTNLSNSAFNSSFNLPGDAAIWDPAIPQPDQGEPEVNSTMPVIDSASYDPARNLLEIDGTHDGRAVITIQNAYTREVIAIVKSGRSGSFSLSERIFENVPCTVQAGYEDRDEHFWGPTFEVSGAPEDCMRLDDSGLITAYPGDVVNGTIAVAGNRILAAWQSRYCRSGFPGHALDDTAWDQVGVYLEIDNTVDLYLVDLFGVAGSQGSTDYREQEEFEGEYDDVGVVPYNCLWTARGVLREDPENLGTTEVVWFQAERLTSGRRDVNRIEAKCVAGAGCAVSWQEDPEGLRPGEGHGPGTGWSGATVHAQTDVWFSFVRWEHFDIVNNNREPLLLADEILDTGRPQPYVPMMVPVRLTNNDRCNAPVTFVEETYCNDAIAAPYGINDQCIDLIEIPLGPQGEPKETCVVDSNRTGEGDFGDLPNLAITGSSRPRLNLRPRDSDGDGVTDDAWVILTLEEKKGLGRFGFLNDEAWDGTSADTGTYCGDPDADEEDNCDYDYGKNLMYHTFAMGRPQTSMLGGEPAKDVPFSLLRNLLLQGDQINPPEVNWITGTFFPPMSTEDMWDFGDYDYLIFNTEIARRSSQITQPVSKAKAGDSGLVALQMWKQGVIKQGGPADVMARRFVIPEDFDEGSANPYDVANMECGWYDGEGGFTEGLLLFDPDSEPNPYYPKGLCGAPALNLTGRTPLDCEPIGMSDGECAGQADMTCTDHPDFGQLCLSTTDPSDPQTLDKMLSWYECPGWNGTDDSNGGNTGTSAIPGACYTEGDSVLLQANTDDQSWYNPVDIAKGHRGFADGDFVQMLYAWSPNYKLNAVGSDRYELYVRRSFDGGLTWTTTPGDLGGEGTTSCETWRDGEESSSDSHVCTTYAAGDPEQSRNVSQLNSMGLTVLDPRFTPTLASMPNECPDWYQDEAGACTSEWLLFTPVTDDNLQGSLDPTDVHNPSRFFVVFETGDNTTVAEGEAEPLDLLYGRAERYGDHYTVWTETDTDTADITVCYPNDPHDVTDVDWAAGTGFCNEFDYLEKHKDSASGEASLTSSAQGDFLYSIWAQEDFDEAGELENGDAMFRRVWYIDEWISTDNSYTLPGSGSGAKKPKKPK